MTLLNQLHQVAVLLLALSYQAQAQQVLRYTFDYGFVRLMDEPTPENINQLMCAHNEYYTERFQVGTNNTSVIFEAQDIDWVYTPDAEKTLEVSLSANITALDGSELPSLNDVITGGLDEDFTDYLNNYILNLGGIWAEVNSVGFSLATSGPVEGRLKEAQCGPNVTEATMAPATTEANNTTAAPTIEGGNTTVAPTTEAANTTAAPSGESTLVSDPTAQTEAPTPPGEGVIFELTYSFQTRPLAGPTKGEVESLMCQTDAFFQDRIREETQEDTVQSHGTFIDWTYDRTDARVTVSFLSNTTASNGSPVPPLFVTSAMNVSPNDILNYITNYVSAATLPMNNVFLETEDVVFENSIYDARPLTGELVRATCPYTVEETINPTVIVMGSPTVAPVSSTASPTATAGNSTVGPTATPGNPTATPASLPTATPGNQTATPTSLPTATSGSPTATPASRPTGTPGSPTPSPTANVIPGGPTVQPELTSGTFLIEVEFIVSNLEGIKDSEDILGEGLLVSWPIFAQEIVENTTVFENAEGLRSLLQDGMHHRRLSVEFVANSGAITVQDVLRKCPDGSHPDATCHNAMGRFDYEIVEEYQFLANETYTTNTYEALTDGTYQAMVEEASPGTPLVIGIIPPDPPTAIPTEGFRRTANVELVFVVSNLDNITDPEEIVDSGLADSWPVFVDRIVNDIASSSSTNRLRRRNLQVSYEAESAKILEVIPEPCEKDGEDVREGLTCHVARGIYTLLLEEDSDSAEVVSRYKIDTEEAIYDGTYYDILKEVDTESPLYFGRLAPLAQSPAPSMVPTVPTVPTVSPMPSSSPRPSAVPSVSLSPTTIPTRVPFETFAPFPTPPVIPPSQFKSTGIFPVRTEFLVSNLDDITDPLEVRSKGLSESWRVYAEEILKNITVFEEPEAISKRFLQARRLTAVYVPDTAIVTEVEQVSCDQRSAKDAVCHNAKAEYKYEITQEILLIVNATYYNATNEGLYNGTYQDILNRESPGTPLVLGTILPNGGTPGGGDDNDDDKMPGWAIFLIILAVLSVCACLAYFIYYYFMREEEDDIRSYQDEDFAYDFFIPKEVNIQTEVDDIRSKSVGVEEEDREGSTASSGSNAMGDPFDDEEEEEAVDIEEDDWEDGDSDENESQENRGLDPCDESANVALLTESIQGDQEKWDDELASGVGGGEYAIEAHRLLLENGDGPLADDGERASAPSMVDPPDGAMVDPDGKSVVRAEMPMQSEDAWEDEGTSGEQQPSYDEVVESQDAWGNLEAAVASQPPEDHQHDVIDTVGPVGTTQNGVEDGAAQGAPQEEAAGWDEQGGGIEDLESDGGWEDSVGDSTSSHVDADDRPEDRWA